MIGHILTLKQLEALVWVADLGSFRKAAQHLNTTQPNISARIAGLEKTLGVVLMERDAGSVRLTDKGRDILQSARATLREAEHLVEVAERPDLIHDRLRLGVTELIACTWLHDYLRRVKAAYPSVFVELTVDLSRNLDRALASNRVDIAIMNAPFTTPVDGMIELGKFEYIWTANSQIARELPGRRRVADQLPYSVLTHARHTLPFIELTEHAALQGLQTSRIVPSNSMTSCVQMVSDGMGVAMLPRALVERDIAAGRLQQIDVDWTPSPLRFAARYHTERMAVFMNRCALIAEEAAQAFDSGASHAQDQ